VERGPWHRAATVLLEEGGLWRQGAAANLVASKQAQQNTLQDTLAQIRAAYSQALTAKRLASLYGEHILPKARAALESSLASYSVGRLDFLGVMTNATTLLEYEIAHAAKIAEAKKAIAKIEELTGVPFTENMNKKES